MAIIRFRWNSSECTLYEKYDYMVWKGSRYDFYGT